MAIVVLSTKWYISPTWFWYIVPFASVRFVGMSGWRRALENSLSGVLRASAGVLTGIALVRLLRKRRSQRTCKVLFIDQCGNLMQPEGGRVEQLNRPCGELTKVQLRKWFPSSVHDATSR